MSFFATGTDAERVAEYRRRAEEMYAHASEASDIEARGIFVDIAAAYTNMANHLESKALAKAMNAAAPLEEPQKTERPPSGRTH
jgi:hypothetical protein